MGIFARIGAALLGPIGMWIIIAAVAVAVVTGAYVKGRLDCSSAEKVHQLEATIAELHRQREAAETVAENERERAANRARDNSELRERLAEYEREIEAARNAEPEGNDKAACDDPATIIDPIGRERMLELRR
jgi:hypothetical protein